jgi:cardiolipin synthase
MSSQSSRIITVPNILTMLRMVMVPIFVTMLFYQRFLTALGIFILAGITDGLDGLLARRFNQKSQLGRILDPIADKLLLVTSYVVLSLPQISPHTIPRHFPVPFWVTAAVISRDIFIIVGAAAINVVTGFKGFRPSLLGKVNTTIQIASVAIILFTLNVPSISGFVLPSIYTIVFVGALFSGVHYVFFATKLLNENKDPDA